MVPSCNGESLVLHERLIGAEQNQWVLGSNESNRPQLGEHFYFSIIYPNLQRDAVCAGPGSTTLLHHGLCVFLTVQSKLWQPHT